jgi:Beta-glucosidase-related glycosidases
MVEEARLDEAVVNLFTTRMKLGVFDKEEDVHYNNIPYSIVDSKEMRQLNKEAAKKSLVLLKNENNILPLKKENIKTLGVIGPNANNRRALVGNYEGTSSHYITILEGLQDYLGEDTRIMYSEGCHLHKKQISGLGLQNDRISEVKGVCDESDIIIACMGLDSGLEGEEGDQGNQYASGDKADLQLPGLQEEVLKVIHESGKPAILILLSGSALAVNFADENISAVIQGFYPGSQTGSAIAELLFGEVNPEGKLPVTFYRSTDELPEFTDYAMKGRTYRYMETEALYPFGYGLSYTDYQYSDLKLEQAKVTKEGVTLHVNVTNGGEMAGVETVQVYVRFNGEHVQKPNVQLKGIVKVPLKAKEEKKVEFNLPVEAFGLYDEQGVYRVLKGGYTVFVGGNQPDVRSEQLTGKKVNSQTITAEEVLNL